MTNVAVVCRLWVRLLCSEARVHLNWSHHWCWMISLALDCRYRIHSLSCGVVVRRMAVDGTGLRLAKLSMKLLTKFTRSDTKLARPDVLVDTIQLFEVFSELDVSLGYGVEVLDREAYVSIWIQDLLVISPLGLELGQGERCLASISDLSTVPSGPDVGFKVVQCKLDDLIPLDLDIRLVVVEAVLDELQVQFENRARLVVAQRRIVQTDVDPAAKGLVNDPNAICREKEDSSVILKYAKEDCGSLLSASARAIVNL